VHAQAGWAATAQVLTTECPQLLWPAIPCSWEQMLRHPADQTLPTIKAACKSHDLKV
jgi:hypothetical protein